MATFVLHKTVTGMECSSDNKPSQLTRVQTRHTKHIHLTTVALECKLHRKINNSDSNATLQAHHTQHASKMYHDVHVWCYCTITKSDHYKLHILLLKLCCTKT